MQIQCVHCGKQYSLRDESAGAQFKCEQCGRLSPVAPAAAQGAKSASQARPRPAAPTSIGRNARKLKSSASGETALMLRIFGGAALMAIGVPAAGFGLYMYALSQNEDHRGWELLDAVVGVVCLVGVCLAVSGVKLMLGRNKSDNS